MISPDGLLRHAKRLAHAGPGRPLDANLRRGISASYYAVFHDLTERVTRHLIGSCDQEIQSAVRRSWSHGEISQLARQVLDRAKMLERCPTASVTGDPRKLGPLLDVVARDPLLVESLRLFNDMQEQRHSADYEHRVSFVKSELIQAHDKAQLARKRLREASPAARGAFFTLLTVRRADFRPR